MKKKLEKSKHGCPIGYRLKKDTCILNNKRKLKKTQRSGYKRDYEWVSINHDGKSPYVTKDHVMMKGSQRVLNKQKKGTSGYLGKSLLTQYRKEGKQEIIRTPITQEIYDNETIPIGDSLYTTSYILDIVGDMHGTRASKKSSIGHEIYLDTLQC